jgi:hypothetical protein
VYRLLDTSGYLYKNVIKKNEIVRYKVRLVAQGFLQKLGIDYEETYSFIVDAITFRFFINLVVTGSLDMHLIDVVIAYLYGSLDNDIYMYCKKKKKKNQPNGEVAIVHWNLPRHHLMMWQNMPRYHLI